MLKAILWAVLIAVVLVLVIAPAAAADCPDQYRCCWTFGSTGSGPGQFQGPRGFRVAFGDAEEWYVVDSGNGRIQVVSVELFGSSFTYLRQIGRWGAGAGELSDPTDLVLVGSTLYVTDTGNHRVQIFTRDGEYVGQFGHYGQGDGEFDSPRFITAMDDTIYVTDAGNHRVQKFTLDGVYVGQWGSEGTGPGQFLSPSGIARTQEHRVAVGDNERGVIQVFTPSGALVGSSSAPGVQGLGEQYNSDYYLTRSFVEYWGLCDGVAFGPPFGLELLGLYLVGFTDPANDHLVLLAQSDPVERLTWGSIKTRFRD